MKRGQIDNKPMPRILVDARVFWTRKPRPRWYQFRKWYDRWLRPYHLVDTGKIDWLWRISRDYCVDLFWVQGTCPRPTPSFRGAEANDYQVFALTTGFVPLFLARAKSRMRVFDTPAELVTAMRTEPDIKQAMTTDDSLVRLHEHIIRYDGVARRVWHG